MDKKKISKDYLEKIKLLEAYNKNYYDFSYNYNRLPTTTPITANESTFTEQLVVKKYLWNGDVYVQELIEPQPGVDGVVSLMFEFDSSVEAKPKDEIKFVITDIKDYIWAKEILIREKLNEKALILFSPVFGDINPKDLAEWILKDQLPVRFQIQLHKMIWGQIPGV